MTEIRNRLKAIPDVRASVRNLTSLRQGAPVDIDLAVTGPDAERLLTFSEKLRAKAETIPGIVDVYSTLQIDNPELLGFDRSRTGCRVGRRDSRDCRYVARGRGW